MFWVVVFTFDKNVVLWIIMVLLPALLPWKRLGPFFHLTVRELYRQKLLPVPRAHPQYLRYWSKAVSRRATASSFLLFTIRAYICVVRTSVWPRSLLVVYMSAPMVSAMVANVWRLT